jgi:hypothetical protein
MHTEGVWQALLPNEKRDWPGWEAALSRPPIVQTEHGPVEAILNVATWGVDVADEPPPAIPFPVEPGAAI